KRPGGGARSAAASDVASACASTAKPACCRPRRNSASRSAWCSMSAIVLSLAAAGSLMASGGRLVRGGREFEGQQLAGKRVALLQLGRVGSAEIDHPIAKAVAVLGECRQAIAFAGQEV